MVLALLVAVLLVGSAATADAAPVRVVVTGDSLIQPLDDVMVRPVKRAGGRVIKDPRPGTGLTRPLIFDWLSHARRQVRKRRPRATVMFIGGGDTEPLTSRGGPRVACCRRAWIDAYADRVERMMRTYTNRKRRHVYWLTLPAPRQDSRRPQFLAINYAIAQAARKAGARAHVVDTVPVLSPGNRFHRRLRYRGESVVVRAGDGVHLSRAGARIARDMVMRAMRRDDVFTRRGQAAATAGVVQLAYERPLRQLGIGAAYALSVAAAEGHSNRIAVAESADAYTVADGGAPLRAGTGCLQQTPREVRCPTPRAGEDRSVFVDAGDAPDLVTLGGVLPETLAEARGGGNGDLIYGSAGNDFLGGGRGPDVVVGEAGIDVLDGGPGNDILGGGPGRDAVSYQGRTRPVSVDLARKRGGGRGERDRLLEIESVIGTSAADVLRGTSRLDILFGGEGRGRDVLRGRAGDDGLIGYRAIGGRGDDVLDAHRVECGSGIDSIVRRTHPNPGPFAHACERLIAIFVVLRPQPLETGRRRAIFGVRCENVGRCSGALALRDREGVLGRKRFSLRRTEDSERLHEVRIRFERRPRQRVVTLGITGTRAYQASRLRVRLR